MTSSAPDIEKARELLREIVRDASGFPSVLAERALRALDGEGAEEWEAFEHTSKTGTWFVRACHSRRVIASYMHEHESRRIARLPRLERAAREAEQAIDGFMDDGSAWPRILTARNSLRSALNDKEDCEMSVPCMRDDSPRDLEPSDELLFLRAVGLAKARGFDWTAIKPEDRGEWARRVLAWEARKEGKDQ